jgi:NAD(P)-dependent dehydrogenase (short-subunit alcohol dehydrogenase family)
MGAAIAIATAKRAQMSRSPIKARQIGPHRSFSAIRRAVSETVDTIGGLDVLVNSADIGTAGMTTDLALANLQAILDVNVRAPVLFAQAAIPPCCPEAGSSRSAPPWLSACLSRA